MLITMVIIIIVVVEHDAVGDLLEQVELLQKVSAGTMYSSDISTVQARTLNAGS